MSCRVGSLVSIWLVASCAVDTMSPMDGNKALSELDCSELDVLAIRQLYEFGLCELDGVALEHDAPCRNAFPASLATAVLDGSAQDTRGEAPTLEAQAKLVELERARRAQGCTAEWYSSEASAYLHSCEHSEECQEIRAGFECFESLCVPSHLGSRAGEPPRAPLACRDTDSMLNLARDLRRNPSCDLVAEYRAKLLFEYGACPTSEERERFQPTNVDACWGDASDVATAMQAELSSGYCPDLEALALMDTNARNWGCER